MLFVFDGLYERRTSKKKYGFEKSSSSKNKRQRLPKLKRTVEIDVEIMLTHQITCKCLDDAHKNLEHI